MEEIDRRRKTKIPVRNMPAPVAWILRYSTGEQLEYLNSLAKSENFKTFVNLVSRFKEYNVYEVFSYVARNDSDLSLFRAAKRGELAGLDALILAAQMAGEEIQRRKKVKIK